MLKQVKHLIPAEDVNMGGIIVKQALPTHNLPYVDPFLLLHHGIFSFRSEAPAIQQGIGPHPHRGFSPVTFVISGEVHHRDSRGNNQIAKAGEVQWMNAGLGITHSERPSQHIVDMGVDQEIIQLWINSPGKAKMLPPKYQYLRESEIPVFTSDDGKIRTKIISGYYAELQGKLDAESDVIVLWSKCEINGSTRYSIDTNYNTMLYLISGSIVVRGYGNVTAKELVVFSNEGEDISIEAKEKSEFILLSGIPIAESIVQQGPFVMNTETEILEAMRDYQMGKMGFLVEE